MVSFWINYGTNYIGGTTLETQSNAAWLVPICLQLVPAAVLFVGMIWMPFSPRWLVHHGREEEARRTLANLRDLPEDHELIELEFLEIKAQSMFEKRSIAEAFPHLQQLTAWNTFKLRCSHSHYVLPTVERNQRRLAKSQNNWENVPSN